MCAPTRNVFEHEGYIEEERSQRKKGESEAAATKQFQTKLERNGSSKKRKGSINNKGEE